MEKIITLLPGIVKIVKQKRRNYIYIYRLYKITYRVYKIVYKVYNII